MSDRGLKFLLLLSVFVIATCGLIYELISSTLASYLLGDSVLQFSTVIGVYLFAMGVGAYLSKFIERNLAGLFVQIELLIGAIGGCSAALLFAIFPRVSSFRVLLYADIFLIGVLVGVEIPLLLRILRRKIEFKELVSKVFTFDYIGALLASLLFPLLLVPHLGLIRTGFLFGILNVIVALLATHVLAKEIPWLRLLKSTGYLVLAVLVTGFVASDRIVRWTEGSAYPDPVIYATSTPYQRIVLTKFRADLRLYLNGNLQFSSRDEYRYHEALVHPALASLKNPRKVLVLGGGDGLAVREILRYDSVESVTLVDLDPKMTELFSTQPTLLELNRSSLRSARVRIVNEDAFSWLEKSTELYDLVVADFPDPSNFSIGKLYSTAFYAKLRAVLDPDGLFVVQCTSPYVARRAFWCIDATLRGVGFQTAPYHVYVPSFGEWGFIIAGRNAYQKPEKFMAGLRFVEPKILPALFEFPPDMARTNAEPNQLNNQVLVRYFEEEWTHYVH
jgi:spermidine synthase